MSRKKLKKELVAEDWCFVCKDGGSLRICDYKDCLKAYHPECVEKDDSLLESGDKWTCDWHHCCICNKAPKYHCFCCPSAVCRGCVDDAEFAVIRNNKGLCESCLELAWLIEEKMDVDSNGSKVDFHERDTVEFLFYEYWEIIKEKEGLTSEQVISAYNQLKGSDSHEQDTVKDGISESDDESPLDVSDDDTDGCKLNRRKKRMKDQLTMMKRKANSKKKEFIGWGSEPLLVFLTSIGKDTSTQMSQYAVMDIIMNYCKEHELFDRDKRKKINFDTRLHALLGRKSASRNSLYNLLTPHLAENKLSESEDESEFGSENIGEVELVPRKKRQQLGPTEKSNTKAEVVNVQKSCFASIVPKNIKLIYLRRSFLQELSEQLETFEAKVTGTFVRMRSDPNDYLQKNSHMLVQVTGVLNTSSMNSEIMLQVSYTVKEVPLRKLSDDDFSEEECEDLRERVKNGLLKRPTVVELEQKARSLHEEMTKHWISRELVLLKNRIDRANEKGWRRELYEYLDSLQLLQKPEEQARLLREIPEVIADDLDPKPVSDDATISVEEEQNVGSLKSTLARINETPCCDLKCNGSSCNRNERTDGAHEVSEVTADNLDSEPAPEDATIRGEQEQNDSSSKSTLARTIESPCYDPKCLRTSCNQTDAAGIQAKEVRNASGSESNKCAYVEGTKQLEPVIKAPRDCKSIMQYMRKEKKELQSVGKELNKYNSVVKDVQKQIEAIERTS